MTRDKKRVRVITGGVATESSQRATRCSLRNITAVLEEFRGKPRGTSQEASGGKRGGRTPTVAGIAFEMLGKRGGGVEATDRVQRVLTFLTHRVPEERQTPVDAFDFFVAGVAF